MSRNSRHKQGCNLHKCSHLCVILINSCICKQLRFRRSDVSNGSASAEETAVICCVVFSFPLLVLWQTVLLANAATVSFSAASALTRRLYFHSLFQFWLQTECRFSMAEAMSCLHNGCCVYMRNKMEHLSFLTFIQPQNETLWMCAYVHVLTDVTFFKYSFLSVFPL